jgi:hypothetical protein
VNDEPNREPPGQEEHEKNGGTQATHLPPGPRQHCGKNEAARPENGEQAKH